jgi:hypothetical protein
MPLVADHPADRAEQMILLTTQLTALITRETALIEQREPPLSGAAGEEKARLANLYRQEMARIAAQRDLISTAPAHILDRLRAATLEFRAALAAHERALTAVKEVTEGIVRTIAEHVAAAQAGPRGYGAGGGYAPNSAGGALTLNQTA